MRILVVVAFIFSTLVASGQTNRLAFVNPLNKSVDLKVVVLDEENSMEPLAFASVIITEKAHEELTNEKGEFSTKLRPGYYTFEIQLVGYQSKTISNVKVVSGKPVVLETSLKALQLDPSVNFNEFFSEKTED